MHPIDRIERRLRLQDMRVLLAVAEAGSMRRAAERLGTSQPAISRSIADLEQALGVRLLDRGRSGVEPTPYGHALLKRAVAVFDELQQGVKDVHFLADPTAGELRVGASIAVATGLVAAVIERLSRRYPRLKFHVLAADTAGACRALEERAVDLAVVHMTEPVAETHMDVETLFHEPHIVVVGAQSPWVRRRGIALTDLMDEPWVLPPVNSRFGAVVVEAFRARGLGLPERLVTSALPVRQVLLASGRYVTMMPRIVLAFPAGGQALKRLPIDLPTTRRPVGIITLKNRTLRPTAQIFLDCVRKIAKPLTREGRLS